MTCSRTTRQSEGGFALAEMLVTISILGIVFAALLGALGTAVRSSDVHSNAADANSALVSAAETVKAAPFTASCPAAPAAYEAYMRDSTPLPSTWAATDLTVVSVTCPSLVLQMVTVAVDGPGDAAPRRLTVAKSERATSLPITTTTTVAPPPNTTLCSITSISAIRHGAKVHVNAISPASQPGCAMPMSARLDGGAPQSLGRRGGPVWHVKLDARPACDDGCTITVYDADGYVVITQVVRT